MKLTKILEDVLNQERIVLTEEDSRIREVYHGTNSIMAKKILSKGFDISKSGLKSGQSNALTGVSTTIDYNIAKEHAEWAAEEQGGEPVILMTFVSNLNLMPGKEFYAELEKYGNAKKVLNKAKEKYDGVIMFDYETEEGLEEFEVNILFPEKLKWMIA